MDAHDRITKATGDTAWALAHAGLAGAVPSPDAGDRLTKALDGAFDALSRLSTTVKEWDESSVTRDEHGRFGTIGGASRQNPVHREERRQHLAGHTMEQLREHLTSLRGGRPPPERSSNSRSEMVYDILHQEQRRGVVYGDRTSSGAQRRQNLREAQAARQGNGPSEARVAAHDTAAATPPEARQAQAASAPVSAPATAAEDQALHDALSAVHAGETPESPEEGRARDRLEQSGLIRLNNTTNLHEMTSQGEHVLIHSDSGPARTGASVRNFEAGVAAAERMAAARSAPTPSVTPREAAENESMHSAMQAFQHGLGHTVPAHVANRLVAAGMAERWPSGRMVPTDQGRAAMREATGPNDLGQAVRTSELAALDRADQARADQARAAPAAPARDTFGDQRLHDAVSYFRGLRDMSRSPDISAASQIVRNQLVDAGILQRRPSTNWTPDVGHELTDAGHQFALQHPTPAQVGQAVHEATAANRAGTSPASVIRQHGNALAPEAERRRNEAVEQERAQRAEREARQREERAQRAREAAERERERREAEARRPGRTTGNPVPAADAPNKAVVDAAKARVAEAKAAGRQPSRADALNATDSPFRGVGDGTYVQREARPEPRVPTIGPVTLERQPAPTQSFRNVFGTDQTPTKAAMEKLWSDPDGVSVRLHTYSASGDSVTCSGALYDKQGNQVGRMERVFRRDSDGLHASHNFYRTENQSGGGSGAVMLGQSLQAYKTLGVKDVVVHPAWVGPYAWATFGYNAPEATIRSMRDKLVPFLEGHGIPKEKAEEHAASCHTLAHFADLDLGKDGEKASATNPGITVHHVSGEKRPDDKYIEMDVHLGKRFMLKEDPWHEGKINLTNPRDPSYQRSKKRLGLVGW